MSVTPELTAMARAIHVEFAGSDPDELIHHPWQKSWEEPTKPRWEQWIDVARAALLALLQENRTAEGVPIAHSRQFHREIRAILSNPDQGEDA